MTAELVSMSCRKPEKSYHVKLAEAEKARAGLERARDDMVDLSQYCLRSKVAVLCRRGFGKGMVNVPEDREALNSRERAEENAGQRLAEQKKPAAAAAGEAAAAGGACF